MKKNMDRQQAKEIFIKQARWQDAQSQALAGDASSRAYTRFVRDDGRTAILMDAPPQAEAAPCPPKASADERRTLGYNATARLAGSDLHAFIALANALRKAGLNAPEIYAADEAAGFALMSDLGNDLYAKAIDKGSEEKLLYEKAIEVLVHIHQHFTRPGDVQDYTLLDYDNLALMAEADLLPQWFLDWRDPTKKPDARPLQSWHQAWQKVFTGLSAPSTLTLRDVHAENLLWLPQQQGLQQIGLIDFQDALYGHGAYDLVSLLEDARRDVAPALACHALAHYQTLAQKHLPDFDPDALTRDYAILGAQRNAKILGIFARLVRRDNKPSYEYLVPRVAAHFKNNLRHEALTPVKNWFASHAPELDFHA
jgi:N-acetylmuramate 1-kinase